MRLLKNSISVFVIAVVFIPVSLFAVVSWYQARYLQLPVLDEGNPEAAVFHLKDQNGKMVTQEKWKNKIVVADFFFTHCPVVCPKMTANLRTVQQAFTDDSNILIQSFTVDPERDSVERLAFYASQFRIRGRSWSLLTGDKSDIYRLARKSFKIVATDGDGGPDDFIHSDRLVLIDANKKIRGFYDGTSASETKQLIMDISK